MVGCHATAEDLVQETMLRVHQHIGSYREGGSFRAWVYRIATNAALSELRRRRYRRADALGSEALAAPDRAVADPGDQMDRRRREQTVDAALGALPDEQRVVILLRVRMGLRIAEIAAVVGVPEGTIKSRLHHAVRKLRECANPDTAPGEAEESHDGVL